MILFCIKIKKKIMNKEREKIIIEQCRELRFEEATSNSVHWNKF